MNRKNPSYLLIAATIGSLTDVRKNQERSPVIGRNQDVTIITMFGQHNSHGNVDY